MGTNTVLTRVNNYTIHHSMKYIPDWLERLPHGTYTLKELMEKTTRNKSMTSLCRTLRNLGLKKEYRITEGSKYPQSHYTWEGKIKE